MVISGYSPMRESMNLDGQSGFFITFVYQGDELSDYRSTAIVIADSESEAIKIAKKYIPSKYENAGHFEIDHNQNNNLGGKSGEVPCIGTYLKKYPHSNLSILNSKGYIRR